MNPYAELLEPSSKWIPGLLKGSLRVDPASNRVVESATGRFVGALIPSNGLSEELARLPLNPKLAEQAINQSAALSRLSPALNALQLTTSIGAVASVANLGVCCVGFAVVLHRLGRIEGKLDKMLREIEGLRDAVERVHSHINALSVARLKSAAQLLKRSIVADSERSRIDLGTKARNLFQESRLLYLELWNQSKPWHQYDVDINTAIELQGRCTACSLGEINAEFILGDMSAFRQAVATVAEDLAEVTGFDPVEVYQSRSDGACSEKMGDMLWFQYNTPTLTEQISGAWEITNWTIRRLEAFKDDADLVESTGLEAHVFVRETQALEGKEYYMLRLEEGYHSR